MHPDDVEPARLAWAAAVELAEPFEAEYRLRRADGEYRWHVGRALPVRDRDGRVCKWIGTCTDIDDLKRADEQLREAERQTAETLVLFEAMGASAPAGYGLITPDFRIARLNGTLAAVSGGSEEELVGRPVAEVVPELWPQLEPLYRQVVETRKPAVGQEIHGPSYASGGESRCWLSSFHPVEVKGELVGIGVAVFDITERKRSDGFRATVMDQMVEGVCAMDAAGGFLFMNAAASKMLGWREDELRGKSMHGTIHFQHDDGRAFPIDDCPIRRILERRETLRVTEDAFTRKDGTIFPVAYSAAPLLAGSNGSPADGVVVVVFRDTSDEAGERARVQRELATLAWIGRVRDALDHGRLVLYSQPIVPLGGGEPRDELLLRMLGPDGELILPGSFLPVAERYGLIGDIDRWVTSQAIRLAATGCAVQANLSADSISHLDLLSLIERELQKTGAKPADVTFEITETALMNDVDAGERFARGLSELGCRLALDDFGTGFGSFTYLKRLPVSYLKIDHEFVRELATDDANQHLVEAIVGLAGKFGYQTMAEGVEDEPTLELLRRLGVDYAQGFYLAPPAAL